MDAEREVWDWLDAWWYLAGDIMAVLDEEKPSINNPKMWEQFVHKSTTLPDHVREIDIKPLKLFLRSVVASWDSETRIYGPRLSNEELQTLSSNAWMTYQGLQRLNEKRDLLEAGEMSGWHPRGEWYKQFKKSESWCRSQLPEWRSDGIAETRSERGDVRFRVSWLKEQNISEPP